MEIGGDVGDFANSVIIGQHLIELSGNDHSSGWIIIK